MGDANAAAGAGEADYGGDGADCGICGKFPVLQGVADGAS